MPTLQSLDLIDLLQKKGLIPPTPLKKGGFKEFCKRSNMPTLNVGLIRESTLQEVGNAYPTMP
jgi:hypothetical protein